MEPVKETTYYQSDRQINSDCSKDRGLWHCFERGSTEIEVAHFLYGLVRAIQPDLVVETGGQYGRTSKVLGQALLANLHGELVVVEKGYNKCMTIEARCRGLPVTVVCSLALDWEPRDTDRIDLLYVDSEYVSRLQEFDYYYPYLTKYSIVCWHDTGTEDRSSRGLRIHIRRLEKANRVNTIQLPTPRGLTIGRVIKN